MKTFRLQPHEIGYLKLLFGTFADMIRAYFPDENCIMTYDEAVKYYKKIGGKR